MADDGQWLGVPEAARLLGVAQDTIYRLVGSGTLPDLRFPLRICRADLLACIDRCRIQPGELPHLARTRPGGGGQEQSHRFPNRRSRIAAPRAGKPGRYGTAADKRTLVSSSEAAGFSGIGTCGSECLHVHVRDAGPNNTTGGQPGAATFWAYCWRDAVERTRHEPG